MAVQQPNWMQNTSWRESGRTVKLGPFDGRLTLFFALLLFLPGYYTLLICFFGIGIFYALEYKGYTLPNAYRKIRSLIAGKKRHGVHYWRKNQFRY
jgi:hypothetical protein